MYTVSQSRDISNNNMGAIDPQIVARNQVKIKSASIESNNQPISRSDRNQYEFDQISLMEPEYDYNKSRNNSFHVKAKKFLTLTPGGGLKPSASTSCLFAAEENSISNNRNNNNSNNDDNTNNNNNSNNSNNTATSPAVIPTRASLTHEWKKLKTPNKCRECNLLVYFNGRECSFCNFIAHKKCVPVIVIKCSGQQVVHTSGFFLGFKSNRKSCQPELLINNSLQLSGLTAQQLQQLQLHQQQQQQLLLQQQQVVTRKVKQTPIQPIFGQPVNVDGRQVVDFVRRFVYEIDTRGLTSKGIYRVSSIKSKVDRLCNYYDQNLSSLVDLSSFHPNIIANALKMYLRQLPEPLLTHRLYNHFIDIGKKYSSNSSAQQTSPKLDGWPTLTSVKQRKSYSFSLSSTPLTTSTTTTSTRPNIVTNNPAYDPLLIVEFKEIIELLPPINRELIAIIMRHLRRVADMSCENQMSAKNLSIIFGPTLLNASNKSLAIVDNIHQARAIELMITWADQIFPQYANYESKAVIDLYLPETQDEQGRSPDTIDRYQLYDTQTVGDKQQKDKFYNNENSYRHQRLSRAGRRSTQNDIETNTNELLSTKTRNDLRELRRQFFTAPTTTTTQQQQHQQTEPTSQVYNTTANKSLGFCPNHSSEPRRAKLINPPGSVPVVKVQPCYCKTLTTNNTMNKP